MPLEKTEYKFPDEADEPQKVIIEVDDDTPQEDRGREPMPRSLVDELEKDELDQYDDNVKIKLKQMRKVWHDERREKETALREQQEAINFAQNLFQENQRIKNILSIGEKEYASTIQSSADLELKNAKRAYKEAFESGDSDLVVEAQQALQEANIKSIQAKNFRLPPLQEDQNPVQNEVQQVQPPNKKAVSWQKQNDWFGQDRGMTAFALGLHEDLRYKGVQVGSDEYYDELDKTIRKRFPDKFEDQDDNKQSTRTKLSTVVAPAVRSTAPIKVKLKQSQINLAKKFGLTPEQYWRAQQELEARNG